VRVVINNKIQKNWHFSRSFKWVWQRCRRD